MKAKLPLLKKIVSVLVPFCFGIYSFVIGYMKGSTFHISVFGFYIVISVLRLLLLQKELKNEKWEKVKVISVAVLMLLTTAALFVPITILVNHEKEMNFTPIMAITDATYVTYKVINVSVRFFHQKEEKTLHQRLTSSINLEDGILSLMNLQYVLSICFSEGDTKLSTFTSVTNYLMFALMLVVASYSLSLSFMGEKQKPKD
jgi:hypothetical protein